LQEYQARPGIILPAEAHVFRIYREPQPNGENTSIDLADLTLVGNSIIPSHDPFGNEIIISEAEITRLKEIDGFFESLAKNIDARQNLLFVLPTLHTNSQGQLVSISLEYKLPDGTSIDPVNILTDIMIQLNDDSGNQYYYSPWLKNENAGIEECNCVNGLFSYTLDKPVDISHLIKITIPYNDLLGNTYFINWHK